MVRVSVNQKEDRFLSSRMREGKEMVRLIKDKDWLYRTALSFIVLSFGESKEKKQYREFGRLLLELSVGCPRSDALLATFYGIPECRTREAGIKELMEYIDTRDGVFARRK